MVILCILDSWFFEVLIYATIFADGEFLWNLSTSKNQLYGNVFPQIVARVLISLPAF